MHRALRDGYRCRSAYKLLKMDDKYHFLNPGSRVVCQVQECKNVSFSEGTIACHKYIIDRFKQKYFLNLASIFGIVKQSSF